MLLNAAGIESLVIYGESSEGPHAWNQVKIEGDWYNVDATWAGSIGKGKIYYGYFCAPDSVFSRDHWPEKPGIAQTCTSFDYYRED
jgi:transglutaminase/protease-like cytokinesis protein 3